MCSNRNFNGAVNSKMPSSVLNNLLFGPRGFWVHFWPLDGNWVILKLESEIHVWSKWPHMEILTALLDLECQIWYGYIICSRKSDSERISDIPIEEKFLIYGADLTLYVCRGGSAFTEGLPRVLHDHGTRAYVRGAGPHVHRTRAHDRKSLSSCALRSWGSSAFAELCVWWC